MDNRRTLIWGGAVAFLAVLSIGGAATFNGGVVGLATGGSGGCSGEPQTVPDEVPDNIVVGTSVAPAVVATDKAKAPVFEDYVVDKQVLFKVKDNSVFALTENKDPFSRVVLKPEYLEQLQELKGMHMVPVFHDRDSDLISHYLDEGIGLDKEPMDPGDIILPEIELIMRLEVEGPVEFAVERMRAMEWVTWVEPVYQMETATTDASLAGYQWNIDTLMIPKVHEWATGNGVKVAVVDSGIRAFDEGMTVLSDLCLDDVDGDANCDDPNGHGTHMASIIGQRPFDQYEVMGIAPDVELIPVRVADGEGYALSHTVANGIVYGVDQGAKVILVGVGTYAPDSRVLYDAIDYAERKGVVVVAPAGNDGFENHTMIPARFNNVIGVGCADMSGQTCEFSNIGPGVDVYAPGGTLNIDDDGDGLADGILGRIEEEGGFMVRDGTSVAAAHVVGQVALMVELDKEINPPVVREVIFDADEPVYTPAGLVVASGTISPLKALEHLRDVPDGQLEAGAECQNHRQCASDICEGQGCGEDPGHCAEETRACTLDYRPYCGCDDFTFFASGTCPNDRYENEGLCD